jgi:virginiamycin B lyase
MRVHALSLCLAVAFVLPAAPLAAQVNLAAEGGQLPELTEWTVPYAESRPRDPMVAPDGHVWFVGQRSDYVAVLDPESGEFKRFDLEEGAGPHNLVVASDGTVFYTGNRASHLGKLDPESGEIEKFMMPDPSIRDPHTLILDSRGDMWFTAQSGNVVGKFWRETGEIRLVQAPEVSDSPRGGSSRPYGIVVDSQDRPWIALFNTNQIGTVDTETFEMTTFDLPRPEARPRRIGVTSDDIVWYVDYADGYLGRLDAGSGEVREWMMPSGGDSRPYAMAVDDSDRIWFVETGVEPNMFVGFDPMTEQFIDGVPLESGGGTVRHMTFDPETNSIWFGADTNTIGVAKLPPRRRAVSD